MSHDVIRERLTRAQGLALWPFVAVHHGHLAALLADRDALERERRRLANVYAGICVRLVRAGVTAFGDAGGAIDMLAADRDALARDLAAARELLREAQDVIYDGKPNARTDIDLLRRIDTHLAATPERPPAHPEWTVCPRCENKIAKCDCATPEREPDVADFIARQKPMPPEIGEAINRNLDRLMDDANECEPGAARSPIQNANESLREQKERELDALLRRGGDA
jgi:hypothetical protein